MDCFVFLKTNIKQLFEKLLFVASVFEQGHQLITKIPFFGFQQLRLLLTDPKHRWPKFDRPNWTFWHRYFLHYSHQLYRALFGILIALFSFLPLSSFMFILVVECLLNLLRGLMFANVTTTSITRALFETKGNANSNTKRCESIQLRLTLKFCGNFCDDVSLP